MQVLHFLKHNKKTRLPLQGGGFNYYRLITRLVMRYTRINSQSTG